MDSRLLATIIIFPIWLTLVLVFRKHRQWLLYYLTAAFGLTLQLVFLAEHFGLDQLLVNIASFHVNLISKNIFHIPIELLSNGRFQLILADGDSSILKLGIECSAILETSIIVSLVLFYPLFNSSQKTLRALFGLVVTYVINILRLMIIVLMAYKFGPDYIFLAHAGVARVFFFIFELLLYWYLMTKPSVGSVGLSIKDKIPLAEAATVGHAFQLRHAYGQLAVIILVIGLSLGSFKVSNEWQKAFVPIAKNDRPIIYQEETSLEELHQETQKEVMGEQIEVIGEREVELLPEEATLYETAIIQAGTINLLSKHQQPILVEIYLNGELVNVAWQEPDREMKLVFKYPVVVKEKDWLEVKVYNEGQQEELIAFEIIKQKEEANE